MPFAHKGSVASLLRENVRLGSTSHSLWATFRTSLQAIWQSAGSQPIGLAVSGGVDSMALARLCSELHQDRPGQRLYGFIVNHGVRRGSHEEASSVVNELSKLNIYPMVLTLNWHGYGDPKTLRNFERIARRLRYQAIGAACYNQGIADLLVAHHADDQAETVLLRIIDGYHGTGLRGIKPKATVPDCACIYGVNASGNPKVGVWPDWDGHSNHVGRAVGIENGGVTLHRPLLPFFKDQLVSLCKETKTPWFEDHTNKDVTLTKRNTLRHLQEESRLPAALQRTSLCAISDRVAERWQDLQEQAQEMFESYEVNFHTRHSFITIEPPKDKRGPDFTFGFANSSSLSEEARRLRSSLLRKMIQPVLPKSDVSTAELNSAVDFIWLNSGKADSATVAGVRLALTVAGVRLALTLAEFNDHERTMQNAILPKLELWRARPSQGKAIASIARMQLSREGRQTEWVLWDHRYWIRVSRTERYYAINPHDVYFEVQFIEPGLIGAVRAQLGNSSDDADRLVAAIRSAASWRHLSHSLPALFACREVAGSVKRECVALPTLGWASKTAKSGIWHVENLEDGATPDAHWVVKVSYKNVELALDGELHKIVG